MIPAAVVLVVALVAAGIYFRTHHAAPLTEKDTVVLADFNNTTGDSVFDDTLKQALAVAPGPVALPEHPFRGQGSPNAAADDTLDQVND